MSYIPDLGAYGMLSDLGKTIGDGIKQYKQQQLLSTLGDDISRNDYTAAMQHAFRGGDLQTGLSLLKLGQAQQSNAAFNAALPGLFGGDGGQSSTPAPTATQSASADGGPYAGAIASIESRGSGDYTAIGPTTKTGDNAYGKYGIMGANVGPWTNEVLGSPMTPAQFRANPQAQDAVFNAKFGQLVAKYGPDGAARAWFAGEGGMNNPNARDILGTSVADYSRKFQSATGQPIQVASADPRFVPQSGAMAYAPQDGDVPIPPPRPTSIGGAPDNPDPAMPGNADVSRSIIPSVANGRPTAEGVQAIQSGTASAPTEDGSSGAGDTAVRAAAAGDPKATAMATYVNASPSGSPDRLTKLAKLAALPGLSEGQQKVVSLLFQRELENGKQPDAVKQYMFARTPQGGGFQGSFADFQKKSQHRGDTIESAITARAKLAPQYGLQPGTSAYQQFVLNGKVPEPDAGPTPEMKATEQKLFATAQEKTRVLTAQIDDLNHALALNDKAYSGSYQPGLAAGIARNAPFGLGNIVVDPDRVAATTEFNNLVGGATLSQGKELFGSRITNYDEKLLQDLKARPDMTPQERAVIISNMIAHRKQVLAETQQDVADMRAGTRFQKGPGAGGGAPGYQPSQSPAVQPQQRSPVQASSPPSRAAAPQDQPIRVSTPQEAASLPSGTTFMTPDGQVRVRH